MTLDILVDVDTGRESCLSKKKKSSIYYTSSFKGIDEMKPELIPTYAWLINAKGLCTQRCGSVKIMIM